MKTPKIVLIITLASVYSSYGMGRKPRLSPTPTPTATVTPSATLTPTPAAPHPVGVSAMLTKSTLTIPDIIKNNPNIRYICIGDEMWHVEPTEGHFDWSKIDSLIAQVPADKFIRLTIAMSGMRHSQGDAVADWAYDKLPENEFITYLDTNPYHHWEGWPNTKIAVPWGSTWLQIKKDLIAAVGARYSSNPRIKIVEAAVFTGANNDWSVPGGTTVDGIPPSGSTKTSRMETSGYTHAVMVAAGKDILDAYATAFPNQVIIWPTGSIDASLETDPLSVAREVRDAAFAKWGQSRFMIANYAFKAQTRIAPPRTDMDWSIVYESRPNSGGQALWNVSGDTTFRMNSGQAGDPVAILEAAIDRFKPYGDYFEIYFADTTDPAMAPAIKYAHDKLVGM